MGLGNFLKGIADAIRSLTGETGTIVANNFASEITSKLQKKASGALSVTSNGTKDVTHYASVNVNVPASAVVTGDKTITANGTHDVTTYKNAVVNVPASAVTSGTYSIKGEGKYDVTNYKEVLVEIESISADGTMLYFNANYGTSYTESTFSAGSVSAVHDKDADTLTINDCDEQVIVGYIAGSVVVDSRIMAASSNGNPLEDTTVLLAASY